MKTSVLKPAVLAVAAVFGAAGLALPAAAALVSTTPAVSFDLSASVTDAEGGGPTSTTNVNLGSASPSRFDPSLGVLTGVTLNLNSTRTQSTLVTSTDGGGTGANFEVTSSGTGSSTAALSAPGIAAGFGSLSQADTCTAKWKFGCTGTASSTSAATTLSAASTSLDAYVGTGSVAVTLSAPTLSAEQQSAVFSGTESTTSTLSWAGTLALEYTYLRHAAASFASESLLQALTLDFGDVALGSTATLDLRLFNLGGDRVGLDLDAFSGTGDTDQLTTNLALFTALAAGSSSSMFQATLDTTTAGLFEATYTLLLSDADVGAESTRFAYGLTLNLRGNVLGSTTVDTDGDTVADPPNNVPEPASLALLAAGLVGLGASRRRAA